MASDPLPAPAARRVSRRLVLEALGAAGVGLGLPAMTGCDSTGLDLATARVDREPAKDAPNSETTMALASFAGLLLGQLTGADRTTNVICSPLSVQVALAMTRNGAAGRTAAEMDRVLDFPALEELNSGLNTTMQILAGRSGKKAAGERKGEVRVDIADQIFGARELTWEDQFLTAMARFYGTGVARSDFADDPDGCRRTINSWVAQQTHDKITDIVPPRAITAETRMSLVNAIYLKAPWLKAFDDAKPGDFTNGGGSTVKAELMHTHFNGQAAIGKGWQAVEIPYLGGDLAMIVILPEAGAAPQMPSLLASGVLTEVLYRLTGGYQVDLTMPKFSFRTTASLSEVFIALGMTTAFTQAADFSLLTKDAALMIDQVLHQGWIAVDEQGTEATAATAVTMAPTGAPASQKVLRLVLDRPFWFVIHDRATRVPILTGRVADPARD